MSSTTNATEKLALARALYATGQNFLIHFGQMDDPPHWLVIPRHLWSRHSVVFEFGMNMTIPVPDMRMDAQGITGTLTFNGKPFTCSVPWKAVFAIVGADKRGRVWDDDMPDEVKALVARDLGLGTAQRVKQRAFHNTVPDDMDTQKTQPRVRKVSVPPWMKVIEGGKATRPD